MPSRSVKQDAADNKQNYLDDGDGRIRPVPGVFEVEQARSTHTQAHSREVSCFWLALSCPRAAC